MRSMRMKFGFAMIGLVVLSACSDKEPSLMNIRTKNPDEFSIMPTNPLEAPEDYAALPEPTPGGTNRADVDPMANAVAALGGDPERLQSDKAFAGEATLLAHAARFGAPANIREQVAAEDLEWRQKNNGKLLERVFKVNVYYESYEAMSLDQHRELDRLRARGVQTPSAPPDPERF